MLYLHCQLSLCLNNEIFFLILNAIFSPFEKINITENQEMTSSPLTKKFLIFILYYSAMWNDKFQYRLWRPMLVMERYPPDIIAFLYKLCKYLVIFDIHGSIHLGNKGFIEIPSRCILFIYLSAPHVSGYAHLQELQMYFANHRCVY